MTTMMVMLTMMVMMMTPQLKKDDMALSLNAPLSSLCLPPTTAPGQSATTPTSLAQKIFVFDSVTVIVIITVIVIVNAIVIIITISRFFSDS